MSQRTRRSMLWQLVHKGLGRWFADMHRGCALRKADVVLCLVNPMYMIGSHSSSSLFLIHRDLCGLICLRVQDKIVLPDQGDGVCQSPSACFIDCLLYGEMHWAYLYETGPDGSYWKISQLRTWSQLLIWYQDLRLKLQYIWIWAASWMG